MIKCQHMGHMLIIIFSPVPEVPQEVALSDKVVTSVFVTWRPPLGGVEGYKVSTLLHLSSSK